MPRPIAPPRRVEALAQECADLLRWLQSSEGASSPGPHFARVLRAYNALVEAVARLPRGRAYLKKANALFRAPQPPPQRIQGDAADFNIYQLALLDESVLTREGWLLTRDGWLYPEPLLKVVDQVREELVAQGGDDGDAAAIRVILQRAKVAAGHVTLNRLKVRVSRARQKAVTGQQEKVSPREDFM